jgi:hypothetical protein
MGVGIGIAVPVSSCFYGVKGGEGDGISGGYETR